MDKSLTIVLPIHNAERTLRQDVDAILEASAELTSSVEVLIVDDGSTDDSFETATELSIEFRQVRVLRRTGQGGLTEALREIRADVNSDVVIVHDGASRVNAEQLRRIWKQQQVLGSMTDQSGVSFADLRRPAAIQPAMENAHRRLLGFQRVKAARSATQRATPQQAAKQTQPAEGDSLERRDKASRPMPTRKTGTGVGIIPLLPAMPNSMLGAISDFAKGE